MTGIEYGDQGAAGASTTQSLDSPTADVLFDGETTAAVRELDRIFQDGTFDQRATSAVVEKLNDAPPIMYTRGGAFADRIGVNSGGSILELLRGIYVPVEAEPAWLPASQRYIHEQIWTAPMGSASAYKRNGKLTCIQSVDTTVPSESTSAGVYASFRADRARFGTLSRVTVDPEIHWTGRDLLDVNHVWAEKVDGRIWFDYRLWTRVYQLNPVSGGWEPLLSNRSAVVTTVARADWGIVGGGVYGHGGSLTDGDAALSFVVEPDRTYLFGVVAQIQVSQSLRRIDHQPIPQPALSDLNAYALFKVDVPAMYLSHVVLAP